MFLQQNPLAQVGWMRVGIEGGELPRAWLKRSVVVPAQVQNRHAHAPACVHTHTDAAHVTTATLSQVHLRASMARARAEVVKLEALEKIAQAHQQSLQRKARRARHHAARQAGLPPARRLPPGQPSKLGPAAAAAGAAAAAAAAGAPAGEAAAAGAASEPAAEVAAVAAEDAPLVAAPAQAGTPEAAAEAAAAAAEAEAEAAAAADVEADEEDGRMAALLAAGVSSTTLELFSVVTRMREALEESLQERLAEREQLEAAPSGGRPSSDPVPIGRRR